MAYKALPSLPYKSFLASGQYLPLDVRQVGGLNTLHNFKHDLITYRHVDLSTLHTCFNDVITSTYVTSPSKSNRLGAD